MPSGPTSNSSTHRSEEFIGTKLIWSSRNKYQVSQKSSPSIYFRPSASIEEAIGASSSKFPADRGSEFDNGFVEARYSRTYRYYENQSVRPSVPSVCPSDLSLLSYFVHFLPLSALSDRECRLPFAIWGKVDFPDWRTHNRQKGAAVQL